MSSVAALHDSFSAFISDPKYKEILILLKAIRNGAVYGAKVRFPHALVMVFLFRSGTVAEKLTAIFKATRTHASNLARFAFIYKSVQLLLSRLNNGKREPSHAFIAGLLGGYWVFGRTYNSVTQQIVIYIFARVALATAKLAVTSAKDNTLVGSKYGGSGPGGLGFFKFSPQRAEWLRNNTWPVFAALSWAGVMVLFETYPETLQSSLRSSMVYIYENAEKWDSPRNFLWHNS